MLCISGVKSLNSVLFVLTLVSIFLAVSVESLVFILQLKGQKFSQWFGKNAFRVHIVITGFFWALSFCFILLLQLKKHPVFHNSVVLKYAGLIVLISGLTIATWGFCLLGIKRSFGQNFFEENVPVVKKSLYKSIKNPEEYGFWMAVLGFAFFTQSLFNLVIAFEFIILMIPHMCVENLPLKKRLFVPSDKKLKWIRSFSAGWFL
jgi:protein-S-isoprenylcysteine O-methyltransferase Ste14